MNAFCCKCVKINVFEMIALYHIFYPQGFTLINRKLTWFNYQIQIKQDRSISINMLIFERGSNHFIQGKMGPGVNKVKNLWSRVHSYWQVWFSPGLIGSDNLLFEWGFWFTSKWTKLQNYSKSVWKKTKPDEGVCHYLHSLPIWTYCSPGN